MYTYIVSIKVKEGEGVSFIELQKFEELTEAKPAGLDHFHILKIEMKRTAFFWLNIGNQKKIA